MTLVNIESHASSKTPSAYVPRHERFDLTMPKSVLQKAPKFTCAHLNYLQCRGESVFSDEKANNLFMNVLRLHWKVSGNVLRSALDQGTALYELLAVELDGRYIIRDLLTKDAAYELLGREAPDGMMILATIVHDIYTVQWRSWSEEQNGQYALIISHAQAISNQLSNNVLAFRGQTAPELRKWAEMTVARHLMAIVTPGHLPRAIADDSTRSSFTNTLSSRMMIVRPAANQVRSNHTVEQGTSNKPTQVPLCPAPLKRKTLSSGNDWRTSPRKRVKFRAHDTYRPRASCLRPDFSTIHKMNHRFSQYSPPTPSPINYGSRRDRWVPDYLSQETSHRTELREVQRETQQQKSDAATCIDFTGINSSSKNFQEHNIPVVQGPSYTDYLRKKANDAASPLTVIKSRIFSHTRTHSYTGSEEGEIVE
ncbi:hypothetical protein E4T50_03658 [Aureobasidium sp. EXF-12298]|nr:hypothetical protein E4T50_03658 [Aureobasidium sp. EXF-12298]